MPMKGLLSEKFTYASVVEIPGLIHKNAILVLLGPNKNVAKQQICKEEAKMSKHHFSAKVSAHLPQWLYINKYILIVTETSSCSR